MTRLLDNPIILGLPDLCADAFALVLQLRAAPPKAGFDEFRGQALEVLRQLERKANDHGVAKSDLDDAVFALCATIDELVQTGDWAEREAWMSEPLAVQRFDEPNAGEVFYDRLQSIARGSTGRRKELLEVYATCIYLGFRGAHGTGQGREELRGILTDAVRQVADGAGSAALSKTARPAESVQERIRRAPIWLWVGIGLVACALVYVGLRWHADQDHQATAARIRKAAAAN